MEKVKFWGTLLNYPILYGYRLTPLKPIKCISRVGLNLKICTLKCSLPMRLELSLFVNKNVINVKINSL